MRNVSGFLAEQSFKRSIITALNLQKINFLWLSKKSKKWLDGDAIGMDIEDVASFHWKTSNYCTLVFNKNVQLKAIFSL